MKVGVAGAAGRMGRQLILTVHDDPQLTLAAATDRPGSDVIGTDAGALMGLPFLDVAVAGDPAAFGSCDVVLDFTSGAASAALAQVLAKMGVAHVIGSTGFSSADETIIQQAAEAIAIVKSGNMSRGVNLLAGLVHQAARALGDADIEIVEMHHRRKVDAPSGTALLLGRAAAHGRSVELDEVAVFAREGHTGPRQAGTIGFAALRGGTVVGEHDVILALDGERVRLGHVGEDRAIYAKGAAAAAKWLHGQPPGLYSMADVLSLQ